MTYKCLYCHKQYITEKARDTCQKDHDIILVPLLSSDLSRLVNFIATGDRNLLTDTLTKTLYKYFRRGSV